MLYLDTGHTHPAVIVSVGISAVQPTLGVGPVWTKGGGGGGGLDVCVCGGGGGRIDLSFSLVIGGAYPHTLIPVRIRRIGTWVQSHMYKI